MTRAGDASGAARRSIVLHLLRHAHAGDPAEWEGPDDARPLSRRGRRQAERLGALLVSRDIRPDVIVTSPLVRAAQTADIVGSALGQVPRVDERLAEPLSVAVVGRIVAAAGGREPMLVGHDPDFSELLTELVGGAHIPMRKGALATLELELPIVGGGGVLRWLLPPELLSDGS